MCAFRTNRGLSAVSLACQYRLQMTPRRPATRRLVRNKKCQNDGGESADELGHLVDTHIYTDNNEVPETTRLQRAESLFHIDDFSEDYDFDGDDDVVEPLVDNVELSQRYYLQACDELNVRPVRRIFQGLADEHMACKNTVLKEGDIKAATIALVGNSICEVVHFEANVLGRIGGVYFSDVLSRNLYITEVRLTWNDLGREGAEAICNSLLKNNNVKVLDLTGNQFKEEDAVFFRTLLEENCGLRDLYLGHNYFRETGGEQLAQGIALNDTLKVLDLSWNHLRLKGAKAVGAALKTNTQLETLNISWNGLYIEGVSHIGDSLMENHSLTELDISCNRLSEACIASFMAGLTKNTTLTTLRVGQNHISHEGAIGLLGFLKAHPSIAISHLDLGEQLQDTFCVTPGFYDSSIEELLEKKDQHVHDDFIKVLKELQEQRNIIVKYGVVFSRDREPLGKQDQTDDELALLNENPHFVLMEFMRLQKLRLVDLFHQMDKDNSRGISVLEFQQGLQAVNIPLKTKTLKKFVRSCDIDNNGEIDYAELMDANRQYKEQLRKYMKAGVPLEQTNIGRIQKVLRKIMITNEILSGFKSTAKSESEIDSEKKKG